jgi:thioredoxin reductase (NADPH)
MSNVLTYSFYFVPLALLLLVFSRRRSSLEKTSVNTLRDSVEAGLTQPASLHPVIDTLTCIGCESCVNACPEFPKHQVLGIVGNKAALVSPTDCIGHGACKTVCPVGAISLVFGTAERGIDIPTVAPDFSTNVDGVYIAGELGGMGLIRNAIEQGRQALLSIKDYLSEACESSQALDVVIIGAGPAGMSATLGAMEAGLSHATIEQSALGGTVANFPRGKLVMTAPAELPLVGPVKFTETSKEELVGFWQQIQRDTGMEIQCDERLTGIERSDEGLLVVKTDKDQYLARTLLLAIGRRGTPRTLGVPGEELAKVTYSMIDPQQYADQAVLVVGGGDTALEAACSIVEETNATVTLSYRSEAFSRAKKKNRERIAAAEADGRVSVLMSSVVTSIESDQVLISRGDELLELGNDVIIVCAGGILPNWLLEDIGVGMETKYGTA